MIRRMTLMVWAMLAMPSAVNAQICQADSITATLPPSQFIVNANGTVTDTKTKLIWKKCVEGLSGADCSIGSARMVNWQQSLAHAAVLTGWRLPNIKELGRMVELQCVYPAANLKLFPSVTSNLFWSSSPVLGNDNFVWALDFTEGTNVWAYKSASLPMWLVRDE